MAHRPFCLFPSSPDKNRVLFAATGTSYLKQVLQEPPKCHIEKLNAFCGGEFSQAYLG